MINVTEPYLPNINRYKKYIDEIYSRNWLTNNGPLSQELTSRLEDYLSVKNLLLVSNGTLALQIASHILDIKGTVLTSPFSFVATVSSQLWEGNMVEFSDIDSETLNMCPKKIEKNISKDTQAILPVHVFGNPCEVEKIAKIAQEHNLKIIYDAAHAFGVKYKGESILNHGDISILSFHATKAFHTVEGGALVFKDKILYEKAKSLINFGFDKGEINHIGINAKMSEFHAAMGLCVLDEIDCVLALREEIHKRYLKYLSNYVKIQSIVSSAELNFTYFPIVLESEKNVLDILEKMKENNIFPRRYFYPSLNQLSYLKNIVNMPVSEDISKRILCLPLFPGLQKVAQDKIIKILLNYLQGK